jgi:pyruvate formate lyase activating enzyme
MSRDLDGGGRPEEEESAYRARYARVLSDGRLECELCPRRCRLGDGQRGLCFVRRNVGGELRLTTYGRTTGLAVDPIEKKPLYHFLPGSRTLSFGTVGCNLTCRFCQNWTTTKSRSLALAGTRALPEQIARAALACGAASVACTYNDPTIFAEYACDVADACHALGLLTVAVTAGYIEPGPRAELYGRFDALNVDLKAFSEDFYHRLSSARLEPVKESLVYIAREQRAWLELTTLLIPGYNDSDAELRALAEWVRDALGAEVPLHFSAFHPDYRLRDVPPTPLSTLRRARRLAQETGLAHVYLGNVRDAEGSLTTCASCGRVLIERQGFAIEALRLDARGACLACGSVLAGRFSSARAAPV